MELKYEISVSVELTEFSSIFGHYFSYICSSPYTWHILDDLKVMSRVCSVAWTYGSFYGFEASSGA